MWAMWTTSAPHDPYISTQGACLFFWCRSKRVCRFISTADLTWYCFRSGSNSCLFSSTTYDHIWGDASHVSVVCYAIVNESELELIASILSITWIVWIGRQDDHFNRNGIIEIIDWTLHTPRAVCAHWMIDVRCWAWSWGSSVAFAKQK